MRAALKLGKTLKRFNGRTSLDRRDHAINPDAEQIDVLGNQQEDIGRHFLRESGHRTHLDCHGCMDGIALRRFGSIFGWAWHVLRVLEAEFQTHHYRSS